MVGKCYGQNPFFLTNMQTTMTQRLDCSDPLVDAARLEAGNASSHNVSGEERIRICQQMCSMLDQDGVRLINRDNPSFCDPCKPTQEEARRPQTTLHRQ